MLLAYRGGHGDAEAEAHTLFGKAAGKRDFTVVVRDRRVVAFNTAISVRCDVSYLVQLGAYDGHRGAHFVT